MSIKTLLCREIQDEFEALKDVGLGTDEYKTTVDGLTKLVDKAIEMDRLDLEKEEKVENRETDNDFRLKEMEEERKNRLINNIIAGAGIVLPIIVTIWGTKASFKFEQEGTVTTIMGRGFVNKLLPRK